MDAVGFATYIQDSATALDYADQRYYANNFGRFMSPDPYRGSGNPRNPTSWNRYSYVLGDPINGSDSSGLDCGVNINGQTGPPGMCPTPPPDTGEPESAPTVFSDSFPGVPIYGGDPSQLGAPIASVTTNDCSECDVPITDSAQQVAGMIYGYNIPDFLTAFAGSSLLTGPAVGTVASSVGAISLVSTATTLLQGATPVLGALAFTTQYASQLEYDILSVTNELWTWEANVSWLNELIQTGQSFFVGPVGDRGYWTAMEVSYLTNAGYTWVGDFLVPPVYH